MTVNVSKPAINVREKLAELDKPTGIAGEAMLRAETPQEQFNLIGAGRRNLIINGGFSIAQRSTSAVTGSGYTTVDRWIFPNSEITTQQVANDRVPYPDKMLKVTAGSSGYGIIRQSVENASTLAGQSVTLSFWAKTSDATSFRVEFQQIFGSGGSGTVTPFNDNDYWKVPNDGWNFYSITLDLPSTLGKTHGSGSLLSVLFGPNSGAANNIVYYSEVQLELGKVATPFEHRSYGEELALCQRYFQAHISGDLYTGFGFAHGSSTTDVEIFGYRYLIPMRSAPTLSASAAGHFSIRTSSNNIAATPDAIVINRPGTQMCNLSFQYSGGGITTGNSYHIVANNQAAATLTFDAEL